jgi:hypothetical protein
MSKAAELAALIGSQSAQSHKNMVINGAMNVAQRSTSSAVTTSAGYFTVDRFRTTVTSASAGRHTQSQATITDLPGFANAIKLDCTTADTSLAAGELLILATRFEGQDLQQLQKGTSSAKSVTVSFYAKGTAKTYMCELLDNDNNRHNTQQFTVSTSWTRHSITFAGDTTGALDDDNGLSFILSFWLHAGSTYSGGTYTANTWATSTAANRAAGIDSFFSSTDNELFITGVQMELGEQATPFEHRSVGDELHRCQRYYQAPTSNGMFAGTTNGSTQITNIGVPLVTPLRAAPTASTLAATPTGWHGNNSGVSGATTAPTLSVDAGHSTTIKMTIGGFSGLTDNRNATITLNGLVLDSEL